MASKYQEDSQLLQQLSESIERLREVGLSSGFDDHEIDCCIERVVGKVKPLHVKSKKSVCQRVFQTLLWIGLVFFSLFLTIFVVSTLHAPTDRVLGQIFSPLAYPAFRLLRLCSLPFSTRFDITEYYDMQCLVQNPFFEEESPDCKACNEVTKVAILQNVTEAKFLRHFLEYHQYRPAVVQGEMNTAVTWNDLRGLFVQHLNRMGQYIGKVTSDVAGIRTPHDLFVTTSEQHVKENENFHAEWITRQLATSQVVREVFKRPSFLPKEGEISLEKIIIVENIRSKAHSLPREGTFPYVWYVQATGAREIVLSPHPYCSKECKTIQFTLYSGEMLFFLEQYWIMESHPVEDTTNIEDISLAFQGYFM